MPSTASAALSRTEVSDAQAVRSLADDPIDDAAVYAPRPIPAPCTVTLADPVDAPFVLVSPDTAGLSVDTALVMLPVCTPDVNVTGLLPPTAA